MDLLRSGGVDLNQSTESEGTKRMKAQILEPHPLHSTQRQSQALVTAQRGLCIASARRFIFDLDKPPSERWTPICEAYRDHFTYVENYMKEYLKTFAIEESLVRSKLKSAYKEIAKATSKSYPGKIYNQEIRAIAQRMGCDEVWLYAFQILYETESACTSVVVHDADGTPHHIRSLDWGMELGPMAIELDVRRGGKTIFIAPTFAFCVGVLTGVRPNGYSISLNQRDTETGSRRKNFKMSTQAKGWPVAFLIRAILENVDSYEEALSKLAGEPLVAPAYFIIAGKKTGQGAVITRDHTTEHQRLNLADQPNGVLVQTNVDHWAQFTGKDRNLKSFTRIEVAAEWFAKTPKKNINSRSLWEFLSIEPVANQCSIFGAYMCPLTGVCDTRVVPFFGRGYTPTSLRAMREFSEKNSLLFWVPVADAEKAETRIVTLDLNSKSSECEVVVQQATNLRKADFCKRTDPYCIIKYEGKCQITITHASTLNPYWNHVMYFSPGKANVTLKMEILDKHSKKRSLGYIKVTLNLLVASEYWIPLKGGEDKSEICLLVRRPRMQPVDKILLLASIS